MIDFEKEARLFFSTIGSTFKIASLGVSQHIWSKIVKKHRYYNPIEYTDGSFALGSRFVCISRDIGSRC